MKWLDVFSRFELSIPDRNRHAPDRLISFPISRNTDFVFPSDFSVPVFVPDQKIQLRERLRDFPDHSRLFSSLCPTQLIAPLRPLTSLRNNLIEPQPALVGLTCRYSSSPSTLQLSARQLAQGLNGEAARTPAGESKATTLESCLEPCRVPERTHYESKEGRQNPKSTPTRVQAHGARRE